MLNKKFIYKHGPQLKWLQDQHVVVVFVLFCVGFFWGGGCKNSTTYAPCVWEYCYSRSNTVAYFVPFEVIMNINKL